MANLVVSIKAEKPEDYLRVISDKVGSRGTEEAAEDEQRASSALAVSPAVHRTKRLASHDINQSLCSSRDSLASGRSPTSRRIPAIAQNQKDKFDLKKAKESALDALQKIKFYIIPEQFRRFYNSELLDKFITAGVTYFQSLFQYRSLHNPMLTRKVLPEELDQAEMVAQRNLKSFAGVYASILLVQSCYDKTQHERLFFETLLEFLSKALASFFKDKRQMTVVQNELGRIFRSDSFNVDARRNMEEAQRIKVHTLTSKQLYRLKHTGDPTTTSRILAQLHHHRNTLSIHSAIESRSPLISAILPSPYHNLNKNILRLRGLDPGSSLPNDFKSGVFGGPGSTWDRNRNGDSQSTVSSVTDLSRPQDAQMPSFQVDLEPSSRSEPKIEQSSMSRVSLQPPSRSE